MTLSRYQILESLGRGQYGQVYRGLCLETQVVVAIKELSLANISTHRFIREVSALSRNHHPNLVNLRGLEYHPSGRYLVMDYCDCGTLRELMDQEPSLSLPQVIELIIDILEGLKCLHQKGIVHCDLKPENIFLSQGSTRIYARIGDLGSSIARDTIANPATINDNSIAGSPAYMAPERFYGMFSYEADLYAVGVMLYELMVGERPFLGAIQQLTKAHLSQTIELPSTLPFFLRTLTQKSLQKLPQNRFSSADEMLRCCQLAFILLTKGNQDKAFNPSKDLLPLNVYEEL